MAPALQRSTCQAEGDAQLIDPSIRDTALHQGKQDHDEARIDPSSEKADRRGHVPTSAALAAKAVADRRSARWRPRCPARFARIVSMLTAFDGAMGKVFDGLPVGSSRLL